MVKGIDTSHWNGRIDFAKVLGDKYQFCIQKCTQGTTIVDATYQTNKNGARKNGVLFGSYHFAQGQDPKKEANWFVKSMGDIKTGELAVLDFEIDIPNAVQWCKTFLDETYRLIGFRPLLYSNQARILKYNWTPVVDANYGLWIAAYGLNICTTLGRTPKTGKWPFWAIWQYCSNGNVNGIAGRVDLNTTNMDLPTLKKYGKPEELVCTHCCPVHCS